MKRSNWLDELPTTLKISTSRRIKRRARGGSIAARRARFEPLEERTLLAILTVNSTLDDNTPGDGMVTLREAIIAANANTSTDLGQTGTGADVIVFTPAVTGALTLTFGEFVVSETLTITGPGRDLLSIDAQKNSRIFNFTADDGDFTITDLSLTRGRVVHTGEGVASGGAISKSGSGHLRLERVNLTGNSAISSTSSSDVARGGGIFIREGELTVISSNITGNSVMGNPARGGGISSSAQSNTLIDSVVSNNSAAGPEGDGGGINVLYYSRYNEIHAELTLTGTSITGNSSSTAGGGIFIRSGLIEGGLIRDNRTTGGIQNTNNGGGGVFAPENLTVRGSTIDANQSATTGGGIGASRDLVVESSTISGNVSAGGGGGVISRFTRVTITNSTVSGNTAAGDGGGVSASDDMSLAHSTVTQNRSTGGQGGGLISRFGDIRIFSSIIAGNTAANGSPDLRSDANLFTVNNSIIGDAAGTSLAEAQTTDANGNLIGNSAGIGPIDPKLGPLAENGGPTRTHALLAGSSAIDANPYLAPPTPTHDYPLNGSFADAQGGPALAAVGGTLISGGYNFGPNQGLNLSSALTNPGNYSLELVFRWDDLPGGWQKIIDFHNLATNVGLYTANSGLHFWNGPFTGNLFAPDTLYRLVLTRDDADDEVSAYINGVRVWSFTDAAGDAVFDGPNQIIRFFQDDNVTGPAEAQAGFVDFIRLYDTVLTPTQVALFENPVVIPMFDQRGAPFARARDADGIGGALIDIGAFEVQGPASNDHVPVITSPLAATVPETTFAVMTLTAVDLDIPPQPVTFSIVGGPDRSRFAITSGNVLTFTPPPDFEMPTDSNGDHLYVVIVQASDGDRTAVEAILVTVTPFNDNGPVFTSPATASIVENTTHVMLVAATDADLPALSVTLSIVGGADQAKFSLTNGQLAFIAPPDFDVPSDSDGDSIYEVVVRADDGQGRTTTQIITVTVTGPPTDYGDAPDAVAGTGPGNYSTRRADNGARHVIVPGLRIGPSLDGESGTLQNMAANADDVDAGRPDDEDGLPNPVADLTLTIGAQPVVNVRVMNATGTGATLYGWIDYNANGVFDNSAEHTSIPVPTGTNNSVVTLVFPAVPPAYFGTTYARFRLSTDPAAANSTGLSTDGEVEDYVATISRVTSLTADSTKTKVLRDGMNGVPNLADEDRFGESLASIGDLDGDGITDLVVGASGDETGGSQGGSSNRGAVHVLFMKADGTVRSSRKIACTLNGGPSLPQFSFFGRSVGNLGDLDGDGVTDLGVGVYEYTSQNLPGGLYVLFMTPNGTVRSHQRIANGIGGGPPLGNNDRFGRSVTSLGDLDGDGINDIAVGASGDSDHRGALYVLFMNPNGTVKASQRIANERGGGPALASFDQFGISAAALGDIDGDGITELAVGASGDDASVDGGGAVYVLFLDTSGRAKSVKKIGAGVAGNPAGSGKAVGSSLTAMGDLDGDGVADLAFGAISEDTTSGSPDIFNHGAFYLLLMKSDGSAKSSHEIGHNTGGGPVLGDDYSFGQAVTSLGDLNGDGVTDVAVGARRNEATYVLFLKGNNSPPVFTSSPTDSVPENSTTVMTVTATDAQQPAESLTFAIVGGVDQARFRISSSGVLTFDPPPNFDAPTDLNGDNVYQVNVQVSDGDVGAATQAVSVTVTPVNDSAPMFTSSDVVNVAENITAVMTVTATDRDFPQQVVSYSTSAGPIRRSSR
jgi:hypothetical protein